MREEELNRQQEGILNVCMFETSCEITISLTEAEYNKLCYIAERSGASIEELVIHSIRSKYL